METSMISAMALAIVLARLVIIVIISLLCCFLGSDFSVSLPGNVSAD